MAVLEILQNSQENTSCARVFLIKSQALGSLKYENVYLTITFSEKHKNAMTFPQESLNLAKSVKTHIS